MMLTMMNEKNMFASCNNSNSANNTFRNSVNEAGKVDAVNRDNNDNASDDDDDNVPGGKLVIDEDLSPSTNARASAVIDANKLSSPKQSTSMVLDQDQHHHRQSSTNINSKHHSGRGKLPLSSTDNNKAGVKRKKSNGADKVVENDKQHRHRDSNTSAAPLICSLESTSMQQQQHSDNSRPASNASSSADQSLRLKIKRKKMATRQSGPSHEIQMSLNCEEQQRQQDGGGDLLTASNSATNEELCGENLNSCKTPPIAKSSIGEEKLERRDVGTWVRTIGSATDAECFGPCEPGSAVTLEGIVWHETTGGILVVNVTWRGKSYVGTLLDCTKSDWSAPRFCESPNVDAVDGSKTPAKGRGLKRCAGSSASLASNRSAASSAAVVANNDTSQKNSTQKDKDVAATADSATATGSTDSTADSSSTTTTSTNTPTSTTTTTTSSSAPTSTSTKNDLILEPSSPLMLECPWSGCDKKYVQLTAVKYHQNSIHFREKPKQKPKNNNSNNNNKTAKTLTGKDKASAVIISNTEAENESLENLFKVVESSNNSTTAPPSLQLAVSVGDNVVGRNSKNNTATGSNSNFNTGVYSDVSDDEEEAPKLERHNDANSAKTVAVATSTASLSKSSSNRGDEQHRKRPPAAAAATNSSVVLPQNVAVATPPAVSSTIAVVLPPSPQQNAAPPGVGVVCPEIVAPKTTDLIHATGKTLINAEHSDHNRHHVKKALPPTALPAHPPKQHISHVKKEPPSTSPKTAPSNHQQLQQQHPQQSTADKKYPPQPQQQPQVSQNSSRLVPPTSLTPNFANSPTLLNNSNNNINMMNNLQSNINNLNGLNNNPMHTHPFAAAYATFAGAGGPQQIPFSAAGFDPFIFGNSPMQPVFGLPIGPGMQMQQVLNPPPFYFNVPVSAGHMLHQQQPANPPASSGGSGSSMHKIHELAADPATKLLPASSPSSKNILNNNSGGNLNNQNVSGSGSGGFTTGEKNSRADNISTPPETKIRRLNEPSSASTTTTPNGAPGTGPVTENKSPPFYRHFHEHHHHYPVPMEYGTAFQQTAATMVGAIPPFRK